MPEIILAKFKNKEWPFLPDAEAPPVDDALLKRYVARQLSPDESKQVSLLIASFSSWKDRYVELINGR